MNHTNADISHLVKTQFPDLSELNLREEIQQVGQIYSFKAGEVIMDYGSYIKLVPLVVEGLIKVVREDEHHGNELFLYYLHPGETCSMSFSCCMMNKRSDIRTTAEEDTSLIGIPIKYVDEWLRKYQTWKDFVMRSYDKRMQELVRTIDGIAFHKMDNRLLQYLQQKATATSSTILHTTHQQIASDLNASREAISRLLKKLEKEGRIRIGWNQIELL